MRQIVADRRSATPCGMIRDNADRASFLGIDVFRVKLTAFVIAGVFAGAGGIIMALFVSGAYPEFAYWTMSGEASS